MHNISIVMFASLKVIFGKASNSKLGLKDPTLSLEHLQSLVSFKTHTIQ